VYSTESVYAINSFKNLSCVGIVVSMLGSRPDPDPDPDPGTTRLILASPTHSRAAVAFLSCSPSRARSTKTLEIPASSMEEEERFIP